VIELPAFYIDFAARARGDRDYRSTTRDVRRLIGELMRAGVDGIIMDLRGNGGGSLIEATELTGLFIPEGPIVQVRDASGVIDINEDTDPAVIYQGPLLVLVDRHSASASEIFAAAIQDYRRGVVVGEPTFGKGTVQNLFDLDRSDDDSRDLGQLKATVAQFFRVSGSSTQHRGVTPDIVFPTALQTGDQGERALSNALPWDAIRPVTFVPLSAPLSALQQARRRHQERVAHSPVFRLLIEEMERQRREQERNRLSLLETTRRTESQAAERRQDELERQLRDALASTSYEESEAKGKGDEEPLAASYGKVTLYEAAQVLRDIVDLERSAAEVRQAGR
jgi:carboxyl-terminal processing protease